MKFPKVKKNKGYPLRVWRAERDLTIKAAAKFFRVSAGHWSLMENGLRHASPRLAARLAEATGAPLEVFLGIKVTR